MAHPPFDFEVITPEGSAFHGSITSLRLTGKDGSFGVLARHAPLVAALDAGLLRVTKADGKVAPFAAGEGFVEVRRGAPVRALVDFLEEKGEIDVARAQKAEQRAKERLRKQHDPKVVDQARAEAALRRAIARLTVAKYSEE
jgi:F-type H+-transporting ATPase subunit epsilon